METENKNNQTPETEASVTPIQTPPTDTPIQPRPIITEDEKEGSVGPVVASVIIIILIIIGGLYFWGSVLKEQGYSPEEYIDVNEDSQIKDLTTQSSSDEISDIESDLNGTDLDNLDDELSDIESTFDSI
ncbi:MAG: hypothetical protein ACI9GH_000254 [Candidatus Paceibacteria bacterium]|jgi:hypothetical protein